MTSLTQVPVTTPHRWSTTRPPYETNQVFEPTRQHWAPVGPPKALVRPTPAVRRTKFPRHDRPAFRRTRVATPQIRAPGPVRGPFHRQTRAEIPRVWPVMTPPISPL